MSNLYYYYFNRSSKQHSVISSNAEEALKLSSEKHNLDFTSISLGSITNLDLSTLPTYFVISVQ